VALSRRGSFRGRQSLRRKTSWLEGPGTNTLATFTVSTTTILGAGQVALEDGLTIARIRGLLTTSLQTTANAGDGFHGAAGIGIVTADAFTVGVTAVPNPVDDIAWNGWLWFQFFQEFSVGLDEQAFTPKDYRHYPIDTKAMRKFGLNEVVFLSVQAVEVGAVEMDVRAATRMLLMLS